MSFSPITRTLTPAAAEAEKGTKDVAINEEAESVSQNCDTPETCFPCSATTLPPFVNLEHSNCLMEQEDDTWKELNSASPSIQRHQCLWAYFNMPALSLADRVGGVASIFAQTDGFRSIVYITSSLLNT